MDDLERALAAAASGRTLAWSESVREALERVDHAFAHHVTVTEAPDGLLAEVVEEAPRLAHRVTSIKADHVTIEDAVRQLLKSVSTHPPVEPDEVVDITDGALDVLGRIVQHRHLGADLVYQAFNVDIDACD